MSADEELLGRIGRVLEDYSVGDDAMRWRPDTPPDDPAGEWCEPGTVDAAPVWAGPVSATADIPVPRRRRATRLTALTASVSDAWVVTTGGAGRVHVRIGDMDLPLAAGDVVSSAVAVDAEGLRDTLAAVRTERMDYKIAVTWRAAPPMSITTAEPASLVDVFAEVLRGDGHPDPDGAARRLVNAAVDYLAGSA